MSRDEAFIMIDDIIVADKEHIKLGLEIIETIRKTIKSRREKIKYLERLKIKIDNDYLGNKNE